MFDFVIKVSYHAGKALVAGDFYRRVPLEPLEILVFVGQFGFLGRVDQFGQPVDDRLVVAFDFVFEGASLVLENSEITLQVAAISGEWGDIRMTFLLRVPKIIHFFNFRFCQNIN